jgi:hypothetical protein
MSKMADLHFSLVEEIVLGKLTFREIAEKHEVPFSWVDTVAREMAEEDAAIYAVECR